MAFIPLEQLSRLYDGYQQSFRVAGFSLLLIQDEGRRFVLHNQCPHQQAPLDGATVSNGIIRCPVHGMQFDLQSGMDTNACLAQKLALLPASFDGNRIGIDTAVLEASSQPGHHPGNENSKKLEW